ncbi:hypothetical protein [Devosia sp. A449]
MLLEHVVQTVDVMHEGKVVSASYFVESGIIHAQIDGRTMRLPLGAKPADVTVKTVLAGALTSGSRKAARLTSLIPAS